MTGKYQNPHCPDSAPRTEATPHEIIQHMLDKGMDVWACMSLQSYDEARGNIGYSVHRVTKYDADSDYPVSTRYAGWKYAIPIDTATMTEIKGVKMRLLERFLNWLFPEFGEY